MKTIKRSLSLLLVFCMMLAFVPAAMAVAPTVTGATINGTSLVITFNSALTNTAADAAAFTVSGVAAGNTISSVTATQGTTVTITLASAAVSTDTVTVSYAPFGTNNLTDGTDAVAAFNAQAVVNNTPSNAALITAMAGLTSPVITPGSGIGTITSTMAAGTATVNLTATVSANATVTYWSDFSCATAITNYTAFPVIAGINTAYIKVVSQDGTTTNVYVVTVTVTASLSNAALITAIAGLTSPVITTGSGTGTVASTVAAGTATVNLTATVSANATVTYWSNVLCTTAITNYTAFPVSTGTNTAYIKVVAQDGITTNIYAVTVTVATTSPFTSVTMSATATGATGAVSLSWSALPTSSTTTYYTVYYGTDSNTTAVYATNITSTSATLTGLTNGTTYYFKVTATRSGYDTASSTVVYATPYIASNTTLEVRTGSSSSTAISSSGTYYLSKASSTGYTASSYAQTFRVYNTGGSQATGVTVTLASTSNFTISSSLSSSTISAGNYESFTIRPVSGLSKGTYSVKVTVSGNNVSTSKVFNVSFTVGTSSGDLYVNTSKTSTSSITKYTFTSKDEGYKALDETTFYVHNDSGSSITSVKVALSGTNKSSFTLDGTSLGTISDDDYETFTVVPKTGLSDGTYKATVTVTSNQGDDYEIALTFVVGDGSGGDNDEFYFTEKKNGSSFSKLTFETVTAGYSALSSQTVYLYNDSGSSLKSVTLSLSGTDKSSFTLGSTSLGTISDGSYATFTVVPKTGLAAGTYTAKVTAEASDGTTSSFTLSFTVKASSTTTTTTTTTTKYTDVTTSAWYYNDVAKASTVGLIDGFADGTFKPDNNLTIAQTIKLAACMHQLYYNGTVTLTNGSPNWYDSYVTYALNNGIISGIYADYLAVITREEFVNIMYNSHPSSDYAILNDLATDYIPDVKSGDTYYSKIFRFYQAGILTGSDNAGTFNPKSNIKRSEVAAILIRIYDKAERIG